MSEKNNNYKWPILTHRSFLLVRYYDHQMISVILGYVCFTFMCVLLSLLYNAYSTPHKSIMLLGGQ